MAADRTVPHRGRAPRTVIPMLMALLGIAGQSLASPCNVGEGGRQYSCVIKTSADSVSGAVQMAGRCGMQRLHFDDSNVDLMADDFYAGHALTELQFTSCSMAEVPYRLIEPACGTLRALSLRSCRIGSRTVPKGRFQRCIQLESLTISGGISTVSTEAFLGLDRMRQLNLAGNEIQRLHPWTFRGLSTLLSLDLQDNRIELLEEAAFEPISRTLQHVELKGNPFHCNCSLQWLKDWINSHKRKENKSCSPFYSNLITCSTPLQGDMATLAFCKRPVTRSISNAGPRSKKPCPCLLQKLAAMLDFRRNCKTAIDQTKKFCSILQAATPSSSSTAAPDEHQCDCTIENMLAKSIMKKSCEDQCSTSVRVSTLEEQYKCHLEKTLAWSNLRMNCSIPKKGASLKYCMSTTTPLPSQLAPAKAAGSGQAGCKTPRASLLTSPFCAGLARLKTTGSKC